MRPVPLALGVAALALGLALAATGVGGGLLARVGFALAALLAGIGALLSLLVRSVDGPDTPSLGQSPDRPGVRRPGDDVDRKLAAAASGSTVAREELHDRAESAVVDALVRRRDCSRERARELLRDGEWTDDPDAAAFFAAEGYRRPSVRDRVRVLLGRESTFRRGFSRATAALWDLARRER